MADTLRKFIDLFSAGGTVRSRSGTAIEVSANGTTTVPEREYKKIVFKQFEDMRRAEERRDARADTLGSDR